MKQFGILILSLLIGFSSVAQDNPEKDKEAKVILEKLGKKLKGYSTMTIDFKLSIKSADLNESQSGKAFTKGTKFFYTTEDRDVYSDGESVWTHAKEDNECYIDAIEDLDGGINPSEIMTIWEKNFKYKHFGTKDGITEIRLYPTNPKESKYHTVILKINEAKNSIKKITIKTKDAMTVQFSIHKLTPNTSLSDAKFTWNKAKHPGVDEIDNR
ncbi:MAG: outer membrane lipoprotein carrier protein LolA [Flavobacteriales bacterium]|jgi:outer membrane lipoprotein-sorting protein|nr:outer membrane lipoprotein carrier protein LolA [Flavobacteriales bacterium]